MVCSGQLEMLGGKVAQSSFLSNCNWLGRFVTQMTGKYIWCWPRSMLKIQYTIKLKK